MSRYCTRTQHLVALALIHLWRRCLLTLGFLLAGTYLRRTTRDEGAAWDRYIQIDLALNQARNTRFSGERIALDLLRRWFSDPGTKLHLNAKISLPLH